MVYIDIIIPLLSLSLCLSMTTVPQFCHSSLLAGILKLCLYTNTGWTVNTDTIRLTGSWCYIFAGWRGEIFFSYVCCLSPGREWVTAGQRACAAWVSSTVPYVLAAVASLVCCCCLCSSERHNSPLACRSDRGVLWTLWRWGCQATRLVISTPTNLSAEPLHPSDIRGRGKTRL